MNTSRIFLSVVSAVTMVQSGAMAQVVRLNQGPNWTEAEWGAFYSAEQGSIIMPLTWVQVLKKPNGVLFMQNSLTEYGYIANETSDLNPQGFPLGFLVGNQKSNNPQFSMNCAACHTRELNVNGVTYRADGGPAFSDTYAFFKDMILAVNHLLTSPLAFVEFQQQVGTPPVELRAELQAWYDLNNLVIGAALPSSNSWGIARMDAVNMAINRTTGGQIGTSPNFLIPGNVAEAGMPVSFPFLWNADRQDLTQWAGTTVNGNKQFAMARNASEALGVFGVTHPVGTNFLIDNSVNYDGLAVIGELTPKIGPPKWPWSVDWEKAQLGSQIYSANCTSCHGIQTGAPRPPVTNTWLTPVVAVGTDTKYYNSLNRHSVSSGLLAGFYYNNQTTVEATGVNSIFLQTVLYKTALKQRFPLIVLDIAPPTLPAAADAAYEARVLHGIWATAPFLHNGSVPTLTELLKNPADRVASFQVGPNYDIVKVGLAEVQPGGSASVFTATGGGADLASGNSNAGHDYGTSLSPSEKDALLEYLKIVGTRFEDVNADDIVNGADLNILLNEWGSCATNSCHQCDFNSDGKVDGGDLAIMLNSWGVYLN